MKLINIESNFKELLYQYVSYAPFTSKNLFPSNPYVRPINKEEVATINFENPITSNEIYTRKNRIINQILFNIYEQDMLFLDENFSKIREMFEQFYDAKFIAKGKFVKPQLEFLAFNFLEKECELNISLNIDSLEQHLLKTMAEYELSENKLCQEIINSKNPELAAKTLLIQMFPDFITEASPLARTVIGSFGVEQSEMMKVFIDEYGYGRHDTKHSTLFENTLTSINLNKNIHYYYEYYFTTSFMVINYFHYLCSNKLNWFKYLGALFYTESSIPLFDKKLSALFKTILPHIDTSYFNEHVHIDKHHSRMVIEKMIKPSIRKYGEKIINDIWLGFETARWILNQADLELIDEIKAFTKHDSLDVLVKANQKNIILGEKHER